MLYFVFVGHWKWTLRVVFMEKATCTCQCWLYCCGGCYKYGVEDELKADIYECFRYVFIYVIMKYIQLVFTTYLSELYKCSADLVFVCSLIWSWCYTRMRRWQIFIYKYIFHTYILLFADYKILYKKSYNEVSDNF